jgi:hypothetical protein
VAWWRLDHLGDTATSGGERGGSGFAVVVVLGHRGRQLAVVRPQARQISASAWRCSGAGDSDVRGVCDIGSMVTFLDQALRKEAKGTGAHLPERLNLAMARCSCA